MRNRIFTMTIAGLLSCLLIGTIAAVSHADYGYYADRLSREHRVASDVDEWIERGNATITASPIFDEGMRLTAWATARQDVDNYEFAIASGVYLFEIPRSAKSIEILVRYKGEPNEFEINDNYEPIAGRVWIRNIRREATRRGYNDQNASETRYGDTFVLRAKNRSETIKIPAIGHVDNGWMELHVVAEGGEQLDVEYIEVTTYRRAPNVRVVQHYTPSYRWRHWNRYTYLYFYDGPIFYSSGYDSYLCWSYPVYDHRYLSIRTYYGGYLGRYRTYHPTRYSYYHTPYYGVYSRGTPVYRKRTQLNRWSAQHDTIRKQYSRSRLAVPTRTAERTQVQNNVRVIIENHRAQAPPPTERVTRSDIITQKQRTAIARTTTRQNEAQRTYSSRSRFSTRSSDSQRRPLLNSRANVNTDRRSPTSVTGRSSQIYRRSVSSYSNRSGSSSSSRYSSRSSSNSTLRSSSTVRTQPRSSSVSSSRSTSTRAKTQSVSRSSSSSSRTRPTTTSRTSTRSSSSSSDDDDDDKNDNRSRTTQRIKSRR